MTIIKRALLATLVPLAVVAVPAPAPAAVEPRPVQPFVPGIDEDPDLADAWQRWESKDIDDYVISVRLSCFCPPADAVRTVIRDDATRRVTQGERELSTRRGWSVDELFAMIRDASVEADRVEVDWTRRGVPKSITVDPIDNATDDETYYSVSLSRL